MFLTHQKSHLNFLVFSSLIKIRGVFMREYDLQKLINNPAIVNEKIKDS